MNKYEIREYLIKHMDIAYTGKALSRIINDSHSVTTRKLVSLEKEKSIRKTKKIISTSKKPVHFYHYCKRNEVIRWKN